jgi:hypothetical protein
MLANASYRVDSHGMASPQAFDLGYMNEPFRLGNQERLLTKNEQESWTIS